jgi:hypothetical protein
MWAKIWEVNGKQLYVRRKIFIPPNKKHYIILHHILLALACSTFQVQGTEISFAVLFKTKYNAFWIEILSSQINKSRYCYLYKEDNKHTYDRKLTNNPHFYGVSYCGATKLTLFTTLFYTNLQETNLRREINYSVDVCPCLT